MTYRTMVEAERATKTTRCQACPVSSRPHNIPQIVMLPAGGYGLRCAVDHSHKISTPTERSQDMTQELIASSPKWNTTQVDLIRQTIAQNCNEQEFLQYLATAQHMDLDPFAREIYVAIYNQNNPAKRRMVIMVGIDGYRKQAAATGEAAGQDDPLYDCCGSDAVACTKQPSYCRVMVYRLVQGTRCGFPGVARWSEFFNPNNSDLWRHQGHNQLAKCAEAQALRKAFPRETSAAEFSADGEQGPPIIVEGAPAALALGEPASTQAHPPPEGELPDDPRPLATCPIHQIDWKAPETPRGSWWHHHPQEGEPACLRVRVLANMMAQAREAAMVTPQDAELWAKEHFGERPRDLTDAQRLIALERYLAMVAVPEEDEADNGSI